MLFRSISFLFLAYLLPVMHLYAKEKKYIYQETTGKRVLETTWTVKEEEDEWVIETDNSVGESSMKYTKDFKMICFEHIDKKSKKSYQMQRDGAELKAKSDATGVKQGRTYEINSQNWVQDFDYGLRPLLQSNENNYSFVIVHPDNLNLNHLVAKKKGVEEITIGDKTYNAQHMIITLEGFKSLFWEADAWYDTETFLLLRYRANEGPGTPMSTIVFIEEK